MDISDKYACAELIQSWAFYRDRGKWPELLDTFAQDGQIAISWFSGSFSGFVERCRQAFESGQRSKHHIFPPLVRLGGERAVAETSVVILVRQKIAGVLADLTSYARFLDRLHRVEGRWRIIERTAIYERDRLDPVEPSEAFTRLFAATDLTVYPGAYRYMAAPCRGGPSIGAGRVPRRLFAYRGALSAHRGLARGQIARRARPVN